MPRKELGMAGSNSGSCDSMASTASNRSQRSDNSYDYLSVEEKECLMFLEETIGSLDAEGDSGVSTDDTDSGEPSKPRRGPVPRDVGRGAAPPGRDQQRGAEQRSGQSPSASPGVPRSIPAANGASGGRAAPAVPAVPAVPAANPAQDTAREGRLGRASAGSHTKSVIIQPPDPFHDEHEWTRGHRSGAKDTKVRTSWGHPEKSPLEEAPQDLDAKRGPPTAPKPRKLPPNIILKTSRSGAVPLATEHNQKVKAAPPPPAASQPSPAGDTAAEKGHSGHRDPKEKEKARREALEKLGLSRDRREPSAQLHPQPGQPAESSVPGVRHMAFKSNTLERSGVGLASSMGSSKEQSSKGSGGSSSLGKLSFMERLAPGFLRGSRPRPVSLGAGKDFAGLQEHEEQEKGSKRRSHPLPGFPRPSRSAVSVKITPKGAADENRREALKKLGLLKE